MQYKKIKKLFFFSICSMIIFLNPLLAESEFSAPSSNNQEIPSEKYYSYDPKYLPLPSIKAERSGPFISTNTGFGRLYNKNNYVFSTPVYEAIFGYHIGNAMKVGCSYQYQHAPLDVKFEGNAYIAGKKQTYNYTVQSGLSLQSVAFKVYTSPPHPLRWKIFTLSPYIAFGTGLAWADMKGVFQARRSIFIGDVGIAAGTSLISTTAGCKYNNWSWEHGMYSVIPYVGVQISF